MREKVSPWGRISAFITKPAVALATLGLIFLLNAAALFYQQASFSSTTAMADQFEQNADDYNTTLAANSYYDENTEAR